MFKRIIVPLVIVLALLVGGYYTYKNPASNSKPKPTSQTTKDQGQISITLKTTNGSTQTSNNIKVKKDSTVLEAMQTAKEQKKLEFTSSSSSMGVLIESINGVKSDATTNQYWSYYLNGTMASQGVGAQKVSAKDTIEWKYEKF
ncbi:MAG: DUF4430 domain-containing protein [bacterium]|nr:DUF4430 domain-containing protein [bacterium]